MNRPEAQVTNSRIMIVEDESVVAMDLRGILEDIGYNVVAVVRTGEQAIEKFYQLRPDLILMDIRIKGLINDGIQTAKYLNQVIDLPIIFLTAQADDITKARAQSVNPAAYLNKPYSQNELAATIERVLKEIKGIPTDPTAGADAASVML